MSLPCPFDGLRTYALEALFIPCARLWFARLLYWNFSCQRLRNWRLKSETKKNTSWSHLLVNSQAARKNLYFVFLQKRAFSSQKFHAAAYENARMRPSWHTAPSVCPRPASSLPPWTPSPPCSQALAVGVLPLCTSCLACSSSPIELEPQRSPPGRPPRSSLSHQPLLVPFLFPLCVGFFGPR